MTSLFKRSEIITNDEQCLATFDTNQASVVLIYLFVELWLYKEKLKKENETHSSFII